VAVASIGCGLIIVIDAFQGELWEGLLTALTPYFIYYAIFDFDHEWKWPIVIGAMGGLTVAGALYKLSLGLPV
jgi:hypothetical protein